MKEATTPPVTLVELLRLRAATRPESAAYTFIKDDGEEVRLTHAELDRRARHVAATLLAGSRPGERALLLYPPGLDFVAAFFGCLYAGVVAVPAHSPRAARPDSAMRTRLEAVARDAEPSLALTTSRVLGHSEALLAQSPELRRMRWLATDEVEPGEPADWQPAAPADAEALAYLQYTSGSTALPKGVMVSHRNALSNAAYIARGFGSSPESVFLSWLPHYHDMGLIGGVVHPLYEGATGHLMSPAAFLQQPFRWLEAVTRLRVTHSAAPNFAYDLCVDRTTPAQRAALDLSSWAAAVNGAEPVRAETLERFAAAFAPAGFRRGAFRPSYGLAEATLLVTSVRDEGAPTLFDADADALERHAVLGAEAGRAGARTLVGSGRAALGTEVTIAHPETLVRCGPDEVGEVWVSGPGVAAGYWGRPDETEATFGARLTGTGEGPFLRTGDLGFLKDGELFVTGRWKDLIVIRGHNYYPQDIEATVERSHAALNPGGCAAFSVEADGGERLVVVQEVERRSLRRLDAGEVVAAVRAAVSNQHGLETHAVVLIKPGTLPRTSSGKTQRSVCRRKFSAGEFEAVGAWGLRPAEPAPLPQTRRGGEAGGGGASPSVEEIQDWLASRISERLKADPRDIDFREPFGRYGMDSATAVSLSGEFEEYLGRKLPPTLLYDYPTIESVARHLAGVSGGDARVDVSRVKRGEPVAVVGMGLRLPGDVKDPESFWRLLREGVDAVTEVPPDRWDVDAFFDADPAAGGKMYARWGAFLKRVDEFDANFFGISAREADSLDPQQRLLLEVTWEALAHAAIPPNELADTQTAVFVGGSTSDYSHLELFSGDTADIGAYSCTGNSLSVMAGRISYLLGLRGPSMTIDTACSSSLVAVHYACQSLLSGEANLALAGGVNLILSPEVSINFCKAGMLSRDGRCKAFDASADGFVRGEGCGVLVLKRLSDAERDGDNVLAVIRGSAVNHDGRSGGLTVPSGAAQQAVIGEALARAGVRAGEVGYVEAHGTGTALGDPIELNALAAAYGGAGRRSPLLVGSVKANIGHLEAAAGVAGLAKVLVALGRRELPRQLHIDRPTEAVEWDGCGVEVVRDATAWPAAESGAGLAGVSSFGISGTNAHVIVGAAPGAAAGAGDEACATCGGGGCGCGGPHLLVVSGKCGEALRESAGRWARHLSGVGAGASQRLGDLCHTSRVGRSHYAHRLAAVGEGRRELAEALGAYAAAGEADDVSAGVSGVTGGARVKVGAAFTGQGAWWAGAGRELYGRHPGLRSALAECEEAARESCGGWSLLATLFGDGPSGAGSEQAGQVALGWALWKLWGGLLGVEAAAVCGHSLGELTAAAAAGAFSLRDALRLAWERGRLMDELCAEGTMAAVYAGEELAREAVEACGADVSLAAVNGVANVSISGAQEEVEKAVGGLEARGFRCQRLRVRHAFHSALMEPMLEPFRAVAEGVEYLPLQVPMVSNLDGRLLGRGERLDADYWVRHVRRPVRFLNGVDLLEAVGCGVVIEAGAHPVLCGLVGERGPGGVPWVGTLRRGRGEWRQLLEAVGRVYASGVEVKWDGLGAEGWKRVEAPTYPFQRRRYWTGAAARRAHPSRAPKRAGRHPLLGERLRSPLMKEGSVYESWPSESGPAYLAGHRVFGDAVMPAAAYLEMALAACAGDGPSAVRDVEFTEPLRLTGEPRRVQLTLSDEDGVGRFEVYSLCEEGGGDVWTLHARGAAAGTDEAPRAESDSLTTLRGRCAEEVSAAECYREFEGRGIEYGPAFQAVTRLWRGEGEVLGEVQLPEAHAADAAEYRLHPVLLDGCFQLLGALLTREAGGASEGAAYLPVGVERLSLYAPAGARAWGHAKLRDADSEGSGATLLCDVRLLDGRGEVLAEVRGLRLLKTRGLSAAAKAEEAPPDWLYEVNWRPAPLAGREAEQPEPDYLATPSQIREGAEPLLHALRREHGLDAQAGLHSGAHALCGGYARRALARLGWEPQSGERVNAPGLAARLGVADAHRRLLGRLLEMLAEDGLLRREPCEGAAEVWEDCWTVVDEGVRAFRQTADDEGAGLRAEWSELLALAPESEAELTLLRECGERLEEILTGALDPLQLLFPGGSTARMERLYTTSPVTVVMNRLLARAAEEAVRALPRGRTLRVLEVGAGTGGTTTYLLERLPAGRTRYVFTDVSPLFTAAAARKFGRYDFVEYRLLDVEREPSEQGFDGERYDLLVAANVLHATADLRQTLRRVRRLLAPGGLLLLLETTGPQRPLDLIFGLTEGWWKFTDRELRPRHALLGADVWRRLFEEEGFAEAAAIPGRADERGGLAQQSVLIARAPAAAGDDTGATRARGRWLILADEGGVGERLAASLRGRGEACVLVRRGAGYAADGAGEYEVRADAREDYARVLRDAREGFWKGVVHLWNLDAARGDEGGGLSPEEVRREIERGCRSTLLLVQALGEVRAEPGPRLWLVTRGAQAVGEAQGAVSPGQAAVGGLRNVLALEHPELSCTCVDLDEAACGGGEELLAEICSGAGEHQVAYRGGERYVARLGRGRGDGRPEGARLKAPAGEPYRLTIGERGVLDDLKLSPAPRRAPGPGELEVEVAAAGLNFRDVLNAMGMYPGDAGPLGGECVGRVVAVGDEGGEFAPGDEVVAFVAGGFASHVIVPAAGAVRKPARLSREEAATIPAPFMTACYGLRHLARIKAGDRVLIHAAAGGVGSAAVQLALRAGAEVYATASPSKWDYLRSLGVERVANSRSLDFAERVLEWTGGEGVDVVLNSLSGDFIEKSFEALGPNGRFVEIGKRGIWPASRVAEVRPDASYFTFDLGEVAKGEPELFRSIFSEVMREFERGSLTPLPRRLFAFEEAAEAFRFMAQAKHVGRVVLARQGGGGDGAAVAFRPDASYLITGGLGGLGLVVARWMVERGARNLLLMGRSAPSAAARLALEELEAMGARASVFEGDVSKVEDVAAALGRASERAPVRGVIHAAGVLDDSLLAQMSWEQFLKVLGPKALGAWHLHGLTRGLPLDFFVLFSSAASLLGSPGQANHAAANAFLDALAHRRRAAGLHGLSINWGAWSGVGAAAERHADERMTLGGLRSLTPEQGLKALEHVWRTDRAQVGVLSVEWARFIERFSSDAAPPFLAEVSAPVERAEADGGGAARSEFLKQLEGAEASERHALLVEYVRREVAAVLGWRGVELPDARQGFFDLGMDSLTALELRNRLQRGLGRGVGATALFDAPTAEGLARYLAANVLGWGAAEEGVAQGVAEGVVGAGVAAEGAGEGGLLERIQELSDEEVDRLLAGRGMN